jgi:hypothetical protein
MGEVWRKVWCLSSIRYFTLIYKILYYDKRNVGFFLLKNNRLGKIGQLLRNIG